MSKCVQTASKLVGFRVNSVPSIFIVDEAEAAAINAIYKMTNPLLQRQNIMIIDSGGGTTDVAVYQVKQGFPLRLGKQLILSDGTNYAGGTIEDEARPDFHNDMKYAKELELNGRTIHDFIESFVMPEFEREHKRNFDINKEKKFQIHIPNLKHSSSNTRITDGLYELDHQAMKTYFTPTLQEIDQFACRKIQLTWAEGIRIDRVFGVGGFSDSPAFRQTLKNRIDQLNDIRDYLGVQVEPISIEYPPQNTGGAGVAIGAVKRALDKTNGPERKPCLSLEVVTHLSVEPRDSDTYPADVFAQEKTRSELSGYYLIRDTLRWIIKAGQGEFRSMHTASFLSEHVFLAENESWVVSETLYASEDCLNDNYKIDHPNNQNALQIGPMEFDVTQLRERIIAKCEVGLNDYGQDYYALTFEIDLEVTGRHIQPTAYFPNKQAEGAIGIPGVHAGLDISAMFLPGTA